jgi:hypothetical protein
MQSNASTPSPPAGWALTQDVPAGYEKREVRPWAKLWVVYLVLFAIGTVLNLFGYWERRQSTTSTTAASNPAEQFHSGQVFSGIGLLFIVAGFVVAVASMVVRIRSLRGTTDGPAPSRDAGATAETR